MYMLIKQKPKDYLGMENLYKAAGTETSFELSYFQTELKHAEEKNTDIFF